MLESYENWAKEVAMQERAHQIRINGYDDQVQIIEGYYQSDLERITNSYQESVRQLNERKEKDLKSLLVPEETEQYKNAKHVLEQIKKRMFETYRINHETMCSLLEQQTGLRWKVKAVAGHGKDFKEKHMERFGIALINENHESFNDPAPLEFLEEENPNHDKNVILCKTGTAWPHEYCVKCQKEAVSYNWLTVYLIEKGLFENNDNEIEMRCGLYKEEIIKAIEKYFEKLSEDESNNGEEAESE